MNLKKLALAGLLIAGAVAGSETSAFAGPMVAAPVAGGASANALVEKARLYCHRGPIFLHWGPCGGGYYWHPHYWRPHYYRPHYWHPHYWHRW